MTVFAFGHSIETMHEGLTCFRDGSPTPMPLKATDIEVNIQAGLAIITTTRTFANVEDVPIEAILTMPIGFDSLMTGLRAKIDGREMRAKAAPEPEARTTYEEAIDRGKMAILHEEVLRGVHMLSVGQLAPGKEVVVELEAVAALTRGPKGPFLRIPVTVGQLYGASPLAPVDDVTTSEQVKHVATLHARTDQGDLLLDQAQRLSQDEKVDVVLDTAIEIHVSGGEFGSHVGMSADGREVQLDLYAADEQDQSLDLAVLFDRSGSTHSLASHDGDLTVWEAIKLGLSVGFGKLGNADKITLWQFDTRCDFLGTQSGASTNGLLKSIDPAGGGTDLRGAVTELLDSGVSDILVLTDGQTWAADVDRLAASKARISAILVGSASLDANIGQLCAMTGGQVFYAPGEDVATAVELAFKALRSPAAHATGEVADCTPNSVLAMRGGISIAVQWSDSLEQVGADAVGRYAAALALPILTAEDAEKWARAHNICTHNTSLILVDDAGDRSEGLSQIRKVPLARPRVEIAAASMGRGMACSESYSSYAEEMLPDNILDSSQGPKAPPLGAPSSEVLRRLRSSDSIQVPRDAAPAKTVRGPRFGINPLFGRRASRTPRDTGMIFDGFDWLVHSDVLLQGDYSSLSEIQRRAVELRSQDKKVKRLVGRYGLEPFLAALGMLAVEAGERLALRFARKVFKVVPNDEWSDTVE